jgi:hypothetical protein
MNEIPLALMVAAASLVVGLAVYWMSLCWRLLQQRKRQALRLAAQAEKAAAKGDEALTSLRIIAKSYLARQVELAEASIRISRVMDQLNLDPAERAPFGVFDRVNAELSAIPILAEWHALSKSDRQHHRKTIARVEKQYAEQAEPAAIHLARFRDNSLFYAVN